MIKTAYCQECNKLTLTAYVACANSQLCADCASKYTGSSPEELKMFMEKQEAEQQTTVQDPDSRDYEAKYAHACGYFD